jgi:sialic acid synthase SpsE
VKYIRTIEKALGDGVKVVTPQEEKERKRLRKVNDL